MPRLALGIEYAGNNYRGWQRQINHPELPSVQASIEQALSAVANHPVAVVCAGRTDAGVHAGGQVIHCDVDVERTMRAWVLGCNANLPSDIRVLWAKVVPVEFNARRLATARSYKYVLYNSSIRPSLLNEFVSWYYIPVDADKMHLAAQQWLGRHDFSSFRAAGCQSKSPTRELHSITIKRRGDMIFFDIMANAFLYHMVRNMVGTLLEIGSGRREAAWAKEVLLAKDRAKAGVTAPPQGLYLVGVSYPAHLQIPDNKSGLWFFDQGEEL